MATVAVARSNTMTLDWRSAVISGLLSMMVFAIVEMAFSWAIRGQVPWRPLAIFGAVALQIVAPGAALARGMTSATGAALLLALGVLSGVILAWVAHRMSTTLAAVAGALFGLAMYYVDLHGFARVFAVLGDLRDWMSVLAYVIQGALAAGLYKALARGDDRIPREASGPDMRRLQHARIV
jgi:hypothetical protein